MKTAAVRVTALLMALFVALTALPLAAAAGYDLPLTPDVEGESIYLENLDNGQVLLEENADEVRYIASLTKMMTVLLLLESNVDLDTVVTVPTELTQEFRDIQSENGADMKLKIGEALSLRELLYGMLLGSANDATSVVAWYVGGGSIPAFVRMMNDRAAELGCTNTTFGCPHGLYDAGNVSTARDLARIAAACYNEPMYLQVCQTLEHTIPPTNKTVERVLHNTNLMMDPDRPVYRTYIQGMKTGFTTLAGRCFVAVGTKNGDTYVSVVLGSSRDAYFVETATVLDWAFDNFSTRVLLNRGEFVAEVPLKGSHDGDSVPLRATQSVAAYGNNAARVELRPTLPQQLKAPVKDGDVIGTVTVLQDGVEIATVDLTAEGDYTSALQVALRNTVLLAPALLALLAILMILCRVAAHRPPPPPAPPKAAPRSQPAAPKGLYAAEQTGWPPKRNGSRWRAGARSIPRSGNTGANAGGTGNVTASAGATRAANTGGNRNAGADASLNAGAETRAGENGEPGTRL